MQHRIHILTKQAQRITAVLFCVVGLSFVTVQAQHTTFSLQVVEFNKVDIRPAFCSPHVSVEPFAFERTAASITGNDNESVLQWVSGGDGKKITIEGKQIRASSSLHVIVRPVTNNMNIISPAVAVGNNVVRDLLVGGSPKSGRAEVRIMFFDTSLKRTEEVAQSVVYTVLDS